MWEVEQGIRASLPRNKGSLACSCTFTVYLLFQWKGEDVLTLHRGVNRTGVYHIVFQVTQVGVFIDERVTFRSSLGGPGHFPESVVMKPLVGELFLLHEVIPAGGNGFLRQVLAGKDVVRSEPSDQIARQLGKGSGVNHERCVFRLLRSGDF